MSIAELYQDIILFTWIGLIGSLVGIFSAYMYGVNVGQQRAERRYHKRRVNR
jgi:hypothetical protein